MNSRSKIELHTITNVTEFLESKAKSFDIPQERARQNVMAINQLVALRTADEPESVEWIKENIDTLVERFARKNADLRGDTARTYGSRTRTSIEEWERYNADPAGWKWKSGKEASPRGPRKLKIVPPPGNVETSTPANDASLHAFRFPDGRVFRFIPPDDFTMADIRRIAWHIATMTTDFDPGGVGGIGNSPNDSTEIVRS